MLEIGSLYAFLLFGAPDYFLISNILLFVNNINTCHDPIINLLTQLKYTGSTFKSNILTKGSTGKYTTQLLI